MRDKLDLFFEKHRRVITFSAVGAANTLVDFAVFTLLYRYFSVGLEISQAAGYTVGIINSFILNRGVTFKKGSTTRLEAQIFRFILVNGVSLLLSIACIRALAEGAGMYALAAKIIVTPLVMAVNYLGYKIIVFGVRDSKTEG